MAAEKQGQATNQAVDDQGSSQTEGRQMLRELRERGFDGSDEKMAVALGRPIEEVQRWMSSAEPIDDDVIMKARGIAKERNIEIE